MYFSKRRTRHGYLSLATWGRNFTLLLCLLFFSGGPQAQVTVHSVLIGVIPDLKAPLSPNQASAPLAPSATDLPPKVVDIHGQPLSFDAGRADMAHRVIVDSFGGGNSGENKARIAQQSAANLNADIDSLSYRFSRAWDGSSFDVISASDDLNKAGPSAPSFSTQFFTTSANVATAEQKTAILDRFDNHPPGGVVLEGSFDPGALNAVVYDARYHALILDMPSGPRVVYLGVPAGDVVTLCHAIAGDDAMRVAVSLDSQPRSYGALTGESNVALNMFVGDHLLGSVAFGSLVDPPDLLVDFRIPGGYTPEKPVADFIPEAVMFTFSSGAYRDDGNSLQPDNNALDVLFVPLDDSPSQDGTAMATIPGEFLDNARHIRDNLAYYRQEPIVALIFRYAQTAALLRGLKTEGVDLDQLASGIAFATGQPK